MMIKNGTTDWLKVSGQWRNHYIYTAQKIKLFIKDLFCKCDQETVDLVTFTVVILYRKLHFLCSDSLFWCETIFYANFIFRHDQRESYLIYQQYSSYTTWEVSKYGVISGPYFPVFSPNTGKYGPEITLHLDTFH